MAINWLIVLEVAKPLFAAAVGAAVARAIERRPQLVAFFAHSGAIKVESQTTYWVHTHSVVVRNAGKKPATNVRVSHNTLPNFTVFPDITFERISLPGGGTDLLFPTLVPGQQITISYLYFPPLIFSQIHSGVRSDEGFAKAIQVVPTPQRPIWQLRTLAGLMLIGLITLVYAAIEAVTAVWRFL